MVKGGGPVDQEARGRFARELNRNFSVVASAGSGKTRAITERIVEIARAPKALELLPRLVVVTFTNRAADEMQQRTRQEILQTRPSLEIVTALNRAYFGTIHGFCLKLLTEHGHHLGLPAPLELVTDDSDLWQEFVQQQTHVGESLPEEARRTLLRVTQLRDLMEFARNAEGPLIPPGELGPCPGVDFSAVYSYPKKSAVKIEKAQLDLREWEDRFRNGWEFLRWPPCGSTSERFVNVWRQAFRPLRKWVGDAALCVAAQIQRDYREFRLERGVVTYTDQLVLADELLQHPAAAAQIRARDYHVILDEAQDTDPTQFSVLLEITRPLEATGRWLKQRSEPPRSGRFCMVGDFQQSIYRARADLRNYRAVHDALIEDAGGEALTLSVTFRLDQKQIDFVNETFQEILKDEAGQVAFVELQPRPAVLPGQVIRLAVGPEIVPAEEKLKEGQKAELVAAELAQWITRAGPEKLRAQSWKDVAILCPRKLWLRLMAQALRKAGVPVSVQSESDLKADNPAYAWLTALCTVMVDPRNSYEVVGVLREIFGISDHDLADFAEGHGDRFELNGSAAHSGAVGTVLQLLQSLHNEIAELPLFSALRQIIEQTQLRERLLALPAEDYGDLGWDLDALMAQAAEMERAGTTLAEFAEKLRQDLERTNEVQPRTVEAIQLITAHKAKGLEWQAVIVPFLARDIRTGSPRYPCLLTNPESGEVLVALGKDDRDEDVRAAIQLAERQEMERLLYVATTRARHTLVLAHDREIFVNSKTKKVPHTSMLAHLKADAEGANERILLGLSVDPEGCAQTKRAAARAEAAPAIMVLPKERAKNTRAALRRAQEFPRKFNPSGYDDEATRQREAAADQTRKGAQPDTPATRYGHWWHELMERISWHAAPRDRDALFAAARPLSPDPERGDREWKLFREHFFKNDQVAPFLRDPGTIVHREFPFLWRIRKDACLEGLVDLLMVDEKNGKALLVDWKTNRIRQSESGALVDLYRPQLTAYWRAVSEITGLPVTPALYSTATGAFLTYEPAQLTGEWERLKALSVGELQDVVANPEPAAIESGARAEHGR